jgi:hypothetical protein
MNSASFPPSIYCQQRDEPDKHFRWFQVYLSMGSNRSLHGAYNSFHGKSQMKSAKVRKASPSWVQAYRQWQWRVRAADWDADQWNLQIEDDRQRRGELQDRLNGSIKKLLDKVDEMLATPIYKVVVSDDGRTTIVTPARWSFDTVARLILVVMKLSELSKEQAREHMHLYREQAPAPLIQASPRASTPDLDDETLALIAFGGKADSDFNANVKMAAG